MENHNELIIEDKPARRGVVARPFVFLTLFAGILFLANFSWRLRDCYVDDAYIGFQFLRQVAAGEGFSYYPGGPPVEGVTNIGWLFLLVPFSGNPNLPGIARILGTILAAVAFGACLFLCLKFFGKGGLPASSAASSCFVILLPAILLVTSRDFLYFSASGMETALLAALILIVPLGLNNRPFPWHLGLLGVYMFLIRPEAVLIVPFAIMFRRLVDGSRQDFKPLVPFFLGILVCTAIRWMYFGRFVPNTFFAKPGDPLLWIGQVMHGLVGRNHNISFPISASVALTLPLLVLGWLEWRKHLPVVASWLAGATASGLFFGMYAAPDWTEMGRYFAPYLGPALLLFWAGVMSAGEAIWNKNVESPKSDGPDSLVRTRHAVSLPNLQAARSHDGPVSILGATLVLGQLFLLGVGFSDQSLDSYPGYVLASRNLVAPSLWLRDNTEPDSVIATRRIGAVAWFSHRPIFDYKFGLPEKEVADQVARRGKSLENPNDQVLKEAWEKHDPQYLLEDEPILRKIIQDCGGTADAFKIHGRTFAIVKEFPIGLEMKWILAQRKPVAPPPTDGALPTEPPR